MTDEINPSIEPVQPVVVDPNVQVAPIDPVSSTDSSNTESTTSNSNGSLEPDDAPNVAASPVAEASASDTALSAPSALQDGATEAGAAGSPSEVEQHPGHSILDRLERKLQSTEAFVLGELLDMIAAVRRTL